MNTLLIVDDNVNDREGIRDLVDWESLDIRVAGIAANGAEGLEKALALRPDLVLTDIAMPLMDGIQMTTCIKSALPQAKFIFMSCYDEFDYARNAIDLEVCAYVLKPIDIAELTGAIQKVLALIAAENEKKYLQDALREQLHANLPVLREQFMRDLIQGRYKDAGDIEARISYLQIPPAGSLLLIWIQIDNPQLEPADLGIEQKYLRIYNVKTCVEETLLQENCGYGLILDNNNLCAILLGDWVTQEDALTNLLETCNLCKTLIRQRSGLQVTFGISDLRHRMSDAPAMFQAAEYAVKSKFYSTGDRILLASEVSRPDESYNLNFGELKQEIEVVFDQGDRELFAALLEKYYPTDACYSEAAMRSLCYLIINAIQLLLSERNEALGTIFGSETIIWEKPLKLETLLSIKEWLAEIYAIIQVYLQIHHSNRYQRIVQDIKHIINEQYPSIENVGQIASSIYFSSGHANFIFLQETGKTIFDYLVERRMEIAKQLLANPYCRIYEVGQRVGYTSKSYFTSIFKDYTGLTPKQFRDKINCKP